MPSRKIIADLTAEQEALLPAYQEKWRSRHHKLMEPIAESYW
jgi:hypothetical protein